MEQHDVLQLFREKAAALGEVKPMQTDIILRLATLLADSRGRLSKENFDELVQIGATMYQEGLGRYRASSELSETMKQSNRDRKPSNS